MTSDDLDQLVADYDAGLDAELALLTQMKRLSEAHRDATAANQLDRITRLGDERERLTASLLTIEHDLAPIRETLSTHRDRAAKLARFQAVVTRHRTAGELIATILASDQESLHGLREAALARRTASQAIEAGEATLAAYRRVIAPPVASAALVDKRG